MADRLRAFGALADAEIARLDVEDLLAELLDRVTDLLDTDTAAVLLLDERSGRLWARAARGVEEEVLEGVSVPVGMGFAGRIAAQRRPMQLDRVDATTVVSPILWEKGIRSMLGVPLVAGRRLLGVLNVGRLSGRRFGADDVTLLELVGERIAAAIQRRELEAERAVTRLLQQSLVPAAVPSCEGLEFATRYVPAERGGVGGDWYDAFVLEDGALWIAVGDVAGHGLVASATMGRLRSIVRAYALEQLEPAEVLERADRQLQLFEPDVLATVLCGVASAPFDTIRLASAGHLLPVLAAEDGPSLLVEMPVGPPLGAVRQASRESAKIELPVGATLLAYTDGLVERVGEVLDAGLERLLAAVRGAPPETLCREVTATLLAGRAPRDDIAMLALRRLAE